MVFKIDSVLQPTNIQSMVATNPKMDNDVSFSNTLKDAIAKVNDSQLESDKKTEMLAMGKDVDLHEVMMTAQKASITLETSVQIQKKMLDAYNEVMRMQI